MGFWIFMTIFCLFIPIIPTEIALKRTFDKNGYRKEKVNN